MSSRNNDDSPNHDLNDDHGGRRDDNGGDDNSSGGHKIFKFDIVNGQVTAVFEMDDGVLEPKSLTDNGRKSYTVEGSNVIRTEIKPLEQKLPAIPTLTAMDCFRGFLNNGKFHRMVEMA